jgi:ech hydrogenase subunit A
LCLIFHAVSKGLLFLCVGSIEQRIGSRDIEDMRGLAQRMPTTTNITVLGIMTMMLPPFGMLLCKWMAIEAATAVPGGTVLLILLLAFGSALTVLYWARFAGIMLGYNVQGPRPPAESQDCAIICSLRILAGAAIVLSLLSPFLYQAIMGVLTASPSLQPFAAGWRPLTVYPLFAILGIGWWIAAKAARRQASQPMALPYLSGIQAVKDGEAGFIGPMEALVPAKASSYYMSNIFGEKKIEPVANIVALTMLALLLGGMLL